MSEKPFLTDVQSLRKRARQHIDEGAVWTPRATAQR
jgi:bacterioferritin